MRRGLELGSRYAFHPGYAIYEPGFLRLGAALARAHAALPQPVYRFMFSEGLSLGFPPERFALEAHLHLLEREAPNAPWMIAGLDVDVTPLIEFAVERGGHVRVGLEDAPFGSAKSNRNGSMMWFGASARPAESWPPPPKCVPGSERKREQGGGLSRLLADRYGSQGRDRSSAPACAGRGSVDCRITTNAPQHDRPPDGVLDAASTRPEKSSEYGRVAARPQDVRRTRGADPIRSHPTAEEVAQGEIA